MAVSHRILSSSLLALAVVMPACSSTSEEPTLGPGGTPTSNTIAPRWVDEPGMFDDGERVVLRAVGVSAFDPNPAAQRSKAITRARNELGTMLQARVQSLVTDYFTSSNDFYGDGSTASSEEFHESVITIITDQTLVGSRQVKAWKDPSDKAMYMLVALDFDSVLNAFEDQIEQTIKREEAQGRLRGKSEDAIAQLDERLAKLRGQDAAGLDESVPPAR